MINDNYIDFLAEKVGSDAKNLVGDIKTDSSPVDNLSDLLSDPLAKCDTVETAVEEIDCEQKIKDAAYIADQQKKAELFAKTPEFKAAIVFSNFVKNSKHIMTGQEKRALYRECLRNTKKGKYDYLFDPEQIAKREERLRAKFDKLNAPVKHTVEDLSPDVQQSLLDMVDKEPWADSSK